MIEGISYDIDHEIEIRDDLSACRLTKEITDLSIDHRDPDSQNKFDEMKGWLMSDENKTTILWNEACTNHCQICIPLGFITDFNRR